MWNINWSNSWIKDIAIYTEKCKILILNARIIIKRQLQSWNKRFKKYYFFYVFKKSTQRIYLDESRNFIIIDIINKSYYLKNR